MRIIFIKEYVDKTTFDNWVKIEEGEEATLIDEVEGKVEFTKGFTEPRVVLEGVPAGCYLPVRYDVKD